MSPPPRPLRTELTRLKTKGKGPSTWVWHVLDDTLDASLVHLISHPLVPVCRQNIAAAVARDDEDFAAGGGHPDGDRKNIKSGQKLPLNRRRLIPRQYFIQGRNRNNGDISITLRSKNQQALISSLLQLFFGSRKKK